MAEWEDTKFVTLTNISKIHLHVEQSSLKTNWRQTAFVKPSL